MKALCVDFICMRNNFGYTDLLSLAAFFGTYYSTYTFKNEITLIVAITKITKN